jgi:hypothetical protein
MNLQEREINRLAERLFAFEEGLHAVRWGKEF